MTSGRAQLPGEGRGPASRREGLGPGLRRETGRAQFDIAWRLALLGWLGCVLLQILLYARPGPYGDPFLLEWRRYFWLSLYFELLGTWLIAGPFLLLWLALWKRPLGPRWRFVNFALVLLLAANLVLSEFDHEVLRFLGTRVSLSFLTVYARTATLGDGLFQDVLLADRGGALFPPLLLIVLPALYLYSAWRMLKSSRARCPPFWLALAIAIVPLAAPLNGWAQASSTFRIRRTEPAILALASDIRLGFEDMAAPPDLAALAADYQRRWLAESSDPGWRFTDPRRPYLRTPTGPAAPEPKRWNVIYLQLESFRGRDMGFLTSIYPSPTPYLDALAEEPYVTTVWTRGLSFGMPTINGLFATHCSIAPHSRRFITSFTSTHFHCLPEALRRRGYRTEMFNAGDTDWDNSTIWLKRWYDRLWRYPEARGHDRPVFRAAAERIRALGRSGRPFFASVVSVSNHTPFKPPEPGFGPDQYGRPPLPNVATTQYTDDVVREFVHSLSREPWFQDTVLVVVGDHGFNLGEHETPAGRISLYHESVWVPILISGFHPRLEAGRRDEVATLLDVAPTIADLLGVREPVAWQGHSLVREGRPASLAFAVQGWKFAEAGDWTMVQAPGDPRPRLFDRNSDWSQYFDRAADHPGVAAALAESAGRARRLNDYLIRNDLVAPR